MWTYVYTDRNNDFLAHAGRKGMKWGKHIFGNAAEEMRQAIARAKASAPTQTNVTSSGRKRNVSGEATGSMERRESVSGGPVNPNGAYNRVASAPTSNTSSGSKLFNDTAAKIASDKVRYEESKRTSPNGLQGRKRNVSGEATGSMERRDAVGRTDEQRNAFNQWNNRSDAAKKFEEMKRRLKLTSRSKAVRHSAIWTYRYTDYNNDYEDFLMHHGILGQKWGVRRFQNPDGTLTEAGKKRYYKSVGKLDNWQSVRKFGEDARVAEFENASSAYQKIMEYQSIERNAEARAWDAYDSVYADAENRLKKERKNEYAVGDWEYNAVINEEIDAEATRQAKDAYKKAFEECLKKEGTDADSLAKAHAAAWTEYDKEVKEFVSSLFTEQDSAKKINNVYNSSTTVGEEAANILMRSAGSGIEYGDFKEWHKSQGF